MRALGKLLRTSAIVVAAWTCGVVAVAAQAPVPTAATPTLHGGQTVDGIVIAGEVGFPAMRLSAFFGSGSDIDFGVQLAAPTYGDLDINGYFQNVGMDVRVPIRFRLLETSSVVGSLRVAPLFHVGRFDHVCTNRGANCDPTVGLGTNVGFMVDFPLPKIFKLVLGLDTRWSLWHPYENNNRFAGTTEVHAGIEALWRQLFFTLIINVGASYWSRNGGAGNNAEPLFRQFAGVGYKF